MKIWDLNTGEIKQSFDSHSDYVYAVDVAKNGHIITGSRDGISNIETIVSKVLSKYGIQKRKNVFNKLKPTKNLSIVLQYLLMDVSLQVVVITQSKYGIQKMGT